MHFIRFNIEKIIKISGHLLRQSMMGSDFSCEDLMDRTTLTKITLRQRLKTRNIKKSTFVIELIAYNIKVNFNT
ncbi:outer membrane lipoprotein-sorting protein [candidate division KSB1 bacterium]|nr:outer membrane lipoprotein-sorting protein [candidate division KSB1 bacterium]